VVHYEPTRSWARKVHHTPGRDLMVEPKDLLRYALEATRDRVIRCLEDLSEEEARRVVQGLSPVVWQVGHLAQADGVLLRRAGAPAPVPEAYAALFGPGTGGQADYPPLSQVRTVFETTHEALLRLLDGAALERPVDAPHYRSVGEMLAFSAYHRGYHIGKMATLRALLGKPRLFG
jgi:uncharacterized damage-inducible protein DinB